jgi:hypothetical protein
MTCRWSLPLADAAAHMGVSVHTLRRRIRRGEPEAVKDDRGRYLVEDTRWRYASTRRPTTPPRRPSSASVSPASVTCVSASICWAVGYFGNNTGSATMIEQYAANSTTTTTTPTASRGCGRRQDLAERTAREAPAPLELAGLAIRPRSTRSPQQPLRLVTELLEGARLSRHQPATFAARLAPGDSPKLIAGRSCLLIRR